MPDEHHDKICRSLEEILKNPKTAMLSDVHYQELESFCADARNFADEGNYDEARRLLKFARDFLDEESGHAGI